MTLPAVRIPYGSSVLAPTGANALPFLPLELARGAAKVTVSALVDSGAALNVLPYDVGIQLGAVWEQQALPLQLVGNLADFEARALLLEVTLSPFAPARLAFAWTKARQVPVILGQVNFFREFDVLFLGSQSAFEIRPKSG